MIINGTHRSEQHINSNCVCLGTCCLIAVLVVKTTEKELVLKYERCRGHRDGSCFEFVKGGQTV